MPTFPAFIGFKARLYPALALLLVTSIKYAPEACTGPIRKLSEPLLSLPFIANVVLSNNVAPSVQQ